MDILQDLAYRGLIYQETDHDGLSKRLQEGPITLYNGFDPTASSMTVGNLVPILLLRRFQLAGNVPIALIGGGTGLIGDPGGKSEERTLNTKDIVQEWAERFRKQFEPLLDFEGTYAARIVDNHDWLGEIRAIDFLRDVGKHFPVPYMLAKESVSSRLEAGISFTEFSYMVLQAYDFLKLSESHGCELQTGGSDQWGNITAGSDLIRRVRGGKVWGLTCPLVTTASGVKFGKTEAGSVWLDPERTTPYQFYQYWLNSEDESVALYLKFFTFLEHEEIDALEEATRSEPHKREAQRRLAEEVTSLVHGPDAVARVDRISRALFYGEVQELALDEIEEGFGDVPSHTLEGSECGLVDLLVAAKISPSKRQAREDVTNGAIYLNGERCTDLERVVRRTDGLHGKYILVRRGKRKYFLVK